VSPQSREPKPFEVATLHRVGSLRLVLRGELDLATSSLLKDALTVAERSGPSVITVDLRFLRFIDATGLGLLLRAARRARDENRRLQLANPTRQIERLLKLTGIDQSFDVVRESASPLALAS
jgi:anti-sigma B factor antagonist